MIDDGPRASASPLPASSNTSSTVAGSAPAPAPPTGAAAARCAEGRQDPGRSDLVFEPAVQSVAGIERVSDERQVADLAGGPVRAAHELVVDDDAHPDARPRSR